MEFAKELGWEEGKRLTLLSFRVSNFYPIVWSYLKILIVMCIRRTFRAKFFAEFLSSPLSLDSAPKKHLLLAYLAASIGLLSVGAAKFFVFPSLSPSSFPFQGLLKIVWLRVPFFDSPINSQALSPLFLLSSAPNILILLVLQTLTRSLMFVLFKGSPKCLIQHEFNIRFLLQTCFSTT